MTTEIKLFDKSSEKLSDNEINIIEKHIRWLKNNNLDLFADSLEIELDKLKEG